MPAHLHQKMLYAGFTYFFSIFCCKSIDLKAFHAFGRISFRWLVFSFWTFYRKKYWFEVFSSFWSSFLLAAISLKFLVSAVNLSGKSTPRFRMRPIRFNTCNFCCIYLLNKLNNKNIECRHTSIKRCYTQGLHIFFNILLQKYWFESFSCFWSNLLSLAGFFLLNVLSKKYWFEVFSSFWSSILLAAFSLKFLVLAALAANLSGKSKTPRLRMRPIRFNTCNFCCIYLLNKLNNKNIECRHTSIKRCYTQAFQVTFFSQRHSKFRAPKPLKRLFWHSKNTYSMMPR